MRKLIALALLSGMLPFTVIAQDSPQDPTLAPPTCKKPIQKTTLRRADGNEDFNEDFTKYQDCIKTYIENQNKLANAHITAANKAVADINAYVKEVNEQNQDK